ncbi:MAG: aquaporin family protein, partial [Microbacterium sp.]
MVRRVAAELLGTGLLVTVVVGSGIAAQRLSTDTGLQLLENSIATALGLGVLILLLGPVSSAHFNPAVSLADALLGRPTRTGLTAPQLAAYVSAQTVGAIGGAVLANSMFAAPTVISA